MSEIVSLPGVGAKRAEILAKLNIFTIEDLLRHYPIRYEDRRRPVPVTGLVHGEAALCRVYVRRVISAPAYTKKGVPPIPMKVICGDDSGAMTLLFFNARWLSGSFETGAEYWVYGTPRLGPAGVSMAHPDFERISLGRETGEARKIVPVYALTAGLTQKFLRGLILAAMPFAGNVKEILPDKLISERRLASISYALSKIHFPVNEHELNAARYRLVYEELFLMQARLLSARARSSVSAAGVSTCAAGQTVDSAAALFAYELTGAQRRAITEIRADMASAAPMNRLLQGDVGSGKTAVAVAAAFFAARAGFQTAMMAPTEILAAQHFAEFERLFKDTGIGVGLITSGLSAAQKREVKAGLAEGRLAVAVGTHALIEPDVRFAGLGLVVTDEQHRFGVRQRMRLREKSMAADTLVMTATPIPRTLALMLYADLDVSVLDEMPPGRKTVATRFVDTGKRDMAYELAEREMNAGRQVYVVAPSIGEEAVENGALISASSELPYPVELASALGLLEELRVRFPHRKIEALHGRMKSEEKDAVMRAFTAGETDMLISTVVIEVGVHVANATVMIIENSERFGLAQLHQLRGRVGRGASESYCVLISDSKSALAVKRGETLARENDGFKIAELDLTLRGPGDLFGVRQHGLPELKIADPAKHMDILLLANKDARRMIAEGYRPNESDCGRA